MALLEFSVASACVFSVVCLPLAEHMHHGSQLRNRLVGANWSQMWSTHSPFAFASVAGAVDPLKVAPSQCGPEPLFMPVFPDFTPHELAMRSSNLRFQTAT